jgi:thioredoxin 1
MGQLAGASPNEGAFMATTTVTVENFQQTVEQQSIVLLDWWAAWCGPCRAFAPVFDAASDKHTDIIFGKINTDEQQELGALFGIRSIPTLMVFRDGILLYAQPGSIPATALEELIRQARSLDMEQVRQELAARAAAEGDEEDLDEDMDDEGSDEVLEEKGKIV